MFGSINLTFKSMAQPELSSRQLRAFIALVEQRNFTRAAQTCHLSQPAFSALIRTLETTLDAPLFDRDTRSVRLTHEGRLFAESAKRLLGECKVPCWTWLIMSNAARAA